MIQVYTEINIGSEISKSGIKLCYKIMEIIDKSISELEHLRLEGLMTIGLIAGGPEQSSPYFREVRDFFKKIRELNCRVSR